MKAFLLLAAAVPAAWLGSAVFGAETMGLDALGSHDLRGLIVREARLPRGAAALLVGAALGTAGAVMQALTRNGLAGPGLLGVNGGANAALAVAVLLAPTLGLAALLPVALLGSAVGAGLVLLSAALIPQGFSPLRLALIGAAVSGIIGAGTTALVVGSGMRNDLHYWLVGGLGTLGWNDLIPLGVFAGAGIALALGASPGIALEALGSEAAAGLGAPVGRIRVAGLSSALLCGAAANAVAGPILFVGFMSPHLARSMVGVDARRVIPAAALVGGLLVAAADVAGRTIRPPAEIPLGVFTAAIGAVFMIGVAARRGAAL